MFAMRKIFVTVLLAACSTAIDIGPEGCACLGEIEPNGEMSFSIDGEPYREIGGLGRDTFLLFGQIQRDELRGEQIYYLLFPSVRGPLSFSGVWPANGPFDPGGVARLDDMFFAEWPDATAQFGLDANGFPVTRIQHSDLGTLRLDPPETLDDGTIRVSGEAEGRVCVDGVDPDCLTVVARFSFVTDRLPAFDDRVPLSFEQDGGIKEEDG